MSKRLKNLVVIGIFILSMVLVMLILVLTAPKDKAETDDEGSKDTTIAVLGYNRDDLATLTIKNEKGEYTIKNGTLGYSIEEYAEFAQNSTIMGAAARCATEINASALVEENAPDLAKYGLAEGSEKASAHVVMKDGTEYDVIFGVNTPDGSTRYFRLGDSKDVYTVALTRSGYFFNKQTDYLSLVITSELVNNNTAPVLDYMTITRKDLDYDIKFEDDTKNYAADEISMASAQVMIEPVYAYLDITNSNDVMYGLWGLNAVSIVQPHPTEEDFEKYGLNDPFCTIDLSAELQRYYLRIGNVAAYSVDEAGGDTTVPQTYFCYFEGIDIIYEVNVSELPWVTFMPIDILSSMMTSNYIYSLDYINVDFIDAKYYFEMKGDIENSVLIEGRVDGEEFDAEDFKLMYQFMLRCPIDDIYFDEAPEESYIGTMEFHRADGKGDILEFYDIGANRVGVKLNGKMSFSQPRGYLTILRQNIETFKAGKIRSDIQEVW